ncbi:MAG TPA: chemotaxis protein CheW [Polyangiaceae bacterium]|nr:chemotaxis protein CheW [Polyangiaceae bacterium]
MSGLYVLFRVAESEYALPAAEVLQLESFEGATRVPGTSAYVEGLVQVRGRVVPVVDLRARFGLPPAERTLESRVIVVEREGRTVALLADSAREIVKLDPAEFRPPPELVAEQSERFVRAVARAGRRLIMLIDPGRVIGEEAPHGERRVDGR